jgi:hypothetical protein
MNINQHFKEIEKRVEECYAIAREARSKGFDPVRDVETPVATSLAEKALGLISVVYPQLSDKRITQRILDLEERVWAVGYDSCFYDCGGNRERKIL